ncbi:MAG: hypothetical protein KIS29_10350 [Thermoplasmata archaeon]|nr:hypothetical protein [Candidatus Sysuiplasma jiujiangense]
MTEFRTRGKGKERKVYPVKKRQAFGVSRDLAYDEVQALRKQGKRARLIETNTRLDLYAPYESILPEAAASSASATQEPSHPVTGESEAKHDIVDHTPHIGTISREKDQALKLIGLLTENGKLQMTNEQLRDFFIDAKISVNNGEMRYIGVDPSHVMMVEETLPTSLPNDFYHIEQGEDKRFTLESGIDPAAARFNMPKLDFETNSWKAQIDGGNLVSLMAFLRKPAKDDPFSKTVTFQMKGNRVLVTGFNEKEAGRERQLKDSHSPDKNTVTVLEFTAQPSKSTSSVNDDTWHTANFDREMLGNMIKTMMARRTVKTDNGMAISLDLKADYPLSAMIRRLGPNNERIETRGLIAPRME